MDFDALLHQLAEKNEWSLLYLQDEDAYRLQLKLPGDRFQDVYVNFRKDEHGSHVAAIWSVIADLADFNLTDPVEWLRFNWRTIYGSLAVSPGDEVVLVQNQLTSEANWNEVERAIHYVGATADTIEKDIYGDRDEN